MTTPALLTCPQCSFEFEASSALALRIENEVKATVDAKLAEMERAELDLRKRTAALEESKRQQELGVQRRIDSERASIRAQATEQLQAEFATTLRERDEEKAALDAKLADMVGAELELRKGNAALEEATRQLELDVQRRVDAARASIRAQATEQLQAEFATTLRRRDEEKAALDAKLSDMVRAELELRKGNAALEEAKRQLELDVQRRVDAARESIRTQAIEHEREDAALKLGAKDLLIDQLRRNIDDMKRKSEQGSTQTQGESQEVLLSERLRSAFPLDSFDEIEKGVDGADLLQKVRDEGGRECGRILWESKRTKNWSDAWLPKLREDQRRASATCAALVSQALPPDITHMQERDGVWICGFALAVPMAGLLRRALLDAAIARGVRDGRESEMELVYRYLTGPDFQRQVQGVVEAWEGMREDLDREKRAMRNIWSKRETLIDMALQGMIGVHRDIKGIAGVDVPMLPKLESPVVELEAIAPSASIGDDSELADTFVFELTRLGGKAGNGALRKSLDLDSATYERVKRVLVGSGRLLLGRGRGGSVALPGQSVDDPELDEDPTDGVAQPEYDTTFDADSPSAER